MTKTPAINTDELLKICSRIGENKTSGLDGTPNRPLTFSMKERPDIFTALYKGIFPAAWKRLPKAAKRPDEPSSYRSICLLDTTGFLRAEETLLDRQYGFHKARSTIYATGRVGTTNIPL